MAGTSVFVLSVGTRDRKGGKFAAQQRTCVPCVGDFCSDVTALVVAGPQNMGGSGHKTRSGCPIFSLTTIRLKHTLCTGVHGLTGEARAIRANRTCLQFVGESCSCKRLLVLSDLRYRERSRLSSPATWQHVKGGNPGQGQHRSSRPSGV